MYFYAYKYKVLNYLESLRNKDESEQTKFDKLFINRYKISVANGEDAISELTNDIISGRLNYGIKDAVAPEELNKLAIDYWSHFEEQSSYIVRGYKDSDGNSLSTGIIEFFKASKVRDYINGRKLKVVYNANNADFSTFDMDKIGSGIGSRFGWGIYFDGEEQWSVSDNSKKFYLNITKPMFNNKKTLTADDVKKVSNALKKEYKIDVFGGSKEISFSHEKEKTVFEFAIKNATNVTDLLDKATNDVQIFKTFMASVYGKMKPKEFLELFQRETGRDGIICWKTDEGQQFVVFNPNQAKYIENLSPTKDNDNYYFSRNSIGVEKNGADNVELEDNENEFRELQKRSREELNGKSWLERSREANEELRGRLSRVFGEEIKRRGYGNGNNSRLLTLG